MIRVFTKDGARHALWKECDCKVRNRVPGAGTSILNQSSLLQTYHRVTALRRLKPAHGFRASRGLARGDRAEGRLLKFLRKLPRCRMVLQSLLGCRSNLRERGRLEVEHCAGAAGLLGLRGSNLWMTTRPARRRCPLCSVSLQKLLQVWVA